jgi:hypothetical protein
MQKGPTLFVDKIHPKKVFASKTAAYRISSFPKEENLYGTGT